MVALAGRRETTAEGDYDEVCRLSHSEAVPARGFRFEGGAECNLMEFVWPSPGAPASKRETRVFPAFDGKVVLFGTPLTGRSQGHIKTLCYRARRRASAVMRIADDS